MSLHYVNFKIIEISTTNEEIRLLNSLYTIVRSTIGYDLEHNYILVQRYLNISPFYKFLEEIEFIKDYYTDPYLIIDEEYGDHYLIANAKLNMTDELRRIIEKIDAKYVEEKKLESRLRLQEAKALIEAHGLVKEWN